MKKVKRLIIPLLLWNLFYAGIVLLLSVKEFTIGREISIDSLLFAPFRDGHQFVYNLGSWFIAPLFSIELVNILTRITVFKKNKTFLKRCLTPNLFILSWCDKCPSRYKRLNQRVATLINSHLLPIPIF